MNEVKDTQEKKKRNEYKKTQGMIALIHDRGDDRG